MLWMKKSKLFLIFFVIIGFMTSGVLSNGSQFVNGIVPPFSITGTIYDSVNPTQVIGGAKITLIVDNVVEDIDFSLSSGEYTVTYRSGLLRAEKPCVLKVEKAGYQTVNWISHLPKLMQPPVVEDIYLVLILPSVYSGTVYDTDTVAPLNPIGDAKVELIENEVVIRTDYTDIDGYYEISYLTSINKNYKLRASHPGCNDEVKDVTPYDSL